MRSILVGVVILTVTLLATRAHAEKWSCTYKGSWVVAKPRDTGTMDFYLMWESAGGSWKVTGEYDDKDGHGVITGLCDKSSCDFEHAYKAGKLAGKTIYFTGSFSDKQLSKTSTENSLTGTWGTSASTRTSGGTFQAKALCLKNGPTPKIPNTARVITIEALGDQTHGDKSPAAIVKLLGEPAKKGTAVEQPATGSFDAEWKWVSGVTVIFTGAKKTGPFKVHMVLVKKPSTVKTAEGYGIGSTRTEVEKAYSAMVDKDESTSTRLVMKGMYNTITFSFEGGKASELTYGPNQEGGGD